MLRNDNQNQEDEMLNACLAISRELVELKNATDVKNEGVRSLIFPKYRKDNKIRISEQESKILFSRFFLEHNILFSVEVPTATVHSFTGSTEISGRYDLVTYNRKGKEADIDWIIELKAHNAPPACIRKDIEKIICSNAKCLWFHTLKNTDSGTLKALKEKFAESVFDVSQVPKRTSSSSLLIVVAVIQKRQVFTCNIDFNKLEFPLNRKMNIEFNELKNALST